MSKPLALAIALALLASAGAFAHEEPATTAQAATPAWVARSNAHAQLLLDAEAKFFPEGASATGLSQWTSPRARRNAAAKRWRR